MTIVGIGVDIVDIARFEASLDRTPGLRDRLFTAAERDLPLPSLAARFAAKEAVAKALGGPGRVGWQDVEIRRDEGAPPVLTVRGSDCEWLLSLSHDGGMAIAMVLAQR